jgi:hypothetical protein
MPNYGRRLPGPEASRGWCAVSSDDVAPIVGWQSYYYPLTRWSPMQSPLFAAVLPALLSAAGTPFATAPRHATPPTLAVSIAWPSGQRDLNGDVARTIAKFKTADPSIERFFRKSAGYAVFPTVAKGAIGVGAAHGDGEVLQAGTVIGTTTVTQVTIGAQLGGQTYSEIIFFETPESRDSFKSGHFTFAAQASAVAVTAGASANAGYNDAVAVFTRAKGGLMYEASVGGQKFTYKPRG